ncbi:hypothetical protein PHJA_000347500 [Phtheirospermum japonicum]|uniref:Uncharacterized protein n=1 Tax=Phtheirospermum japonicum TaxID=374723 RepID=A0A830B862_9LAMI|nr:hypothetical protein PHJA_000347500 [Phtheirospermum japonicum]
MTLTTYHSTRKSFVYNFFPLKEDEERSAAISTAFGPRLHRGLVEIRDVHPPPELDPHHPWKIKKTLNPYEIASGKIIVSFQDAFEHVLRYWNYFMAKHVTMFGRKVSVVVWDVTNEKNPRKYEGNNVFFQMTPSEQCLITCSEMMKDRKLKADDNIGLYWEPRESVFRFRLFYSSGR